MGARKVFEKRFDSVNNLPRFRKVDTTETENKCDLSTFENDM